MKEKVLEAFGKLNIKLEQTDDTACSFNLNGHTLSCVYGNDNERVLRIIVPEICNYGNLEATQIFPILNRINSRWRYIKAYSIGESMCLSYERELCQNDVDLTPVMSLMIRDLEETIPQVQMFVDNIMKKLSEPNGTADTRVLIGAGDSVETDKETAQSINRLGYVDLGLSVKWSTHNVGAEGPSDNGDFFAWGETSTKLVYAKHNGCEVVGWREEDYADITYIDVAHALWGKFWRLPTMEEMQELIDNCDWVWSQQGGHSGYKVTSKKNGRCIFLPAAGRRYESELEDAGEEGYYWTSTPFDRRKANAYRLFFNFHSHYVSCADGNCYQGFSVRPVWVSAK